MKNIVISADGDRMVYSVPDIVAEKYRMHGALYHNETDFIEYLNKWIFSGEISSLVENLGWIDSNDFLPEPYKYCSKFNF